MKNIRFEIEDYFLFLKSKIMLKKFNSKNIIRIVFNKEKRKSQME